MYIKKYEYETLYNLDSYAYRIYELAMELDSMSSKLEEHLDKYGESNEYNAETYDKVEDLVTVVDQSSKMLDLAFNYLYREVKHYRK